jgi:hypothetical protein
MRYLKILPLILLLGFAPVSAGPESAPMPRGKVSVPVSNPVKPNPSPKIAPPLAAEPELIGATTFDYLAEFKVRNVPQGTAVIWDVYPDDQKTVTRIIKVEKACIIAGPARQYSIKVRLVKGEDVSEFKKNFTLTHGAPPGPGPTPKPDDPPIPDPTPAPIAEPGFRVMVVYQDTLRNKYSSDQRAVIFGEEFRDYVRTKAVKGVDGVTPEVRIWDVDIPGVENETDLWKKVWARPHPLKAKNASGQEVDVLWLIVSNGKTGWEGPIFPDTPLAEVMATLKKHGG